MEENPSAAGWVNPRLPLTGPTITDPSRFNLCRHPVATATTDLPHCADSPSVDESERRLAGYGLAGNVGVKDPTCTLESRRRFTLCRPPVATATTDLPHCADSPSVDESKRRLASDGLAGRPEEESLVAGDSEASSCDDSHFSGYSLPPYLIKENPEMWAKAVREADAWMEEEMRKGNF